jgi:hypothetical protein
MIDHEFHKAGNSGLESGRMTHDVWDRDLEAAKTTKKRAGEEGLWWTSNLN